MSAGGAGAEDALLARLRTCAERYRELQGRLSDPELHARAGAMAAVLREMGSLRERAESYSRWEELQQRRQQADTVLQEEGASELGDLAREELAQIEAELEGLAERLRQEVVDDDPHRGRNVILELRAGTGGDEASLFVADLVRIYSRFAESHGLRVEVLDRHPTEVGGYKELTLCISGPRAWDLFRYEAGGHRVQRVPETEAAGRIHTSAATVAVLPEAEEVDVEIDEGDLRTDAYRASGPGGQNVNKTSSACRITHMPSGVVVQCQDESSFHKNRSKAMRMLRSRLLDQATRAQKEEEDRSRRSQIGSGDRSERIRTYNWPQSRVTDHRIKTNYGLDAVLLGRLDDIVDDLRRHDIEEKLAALGEGAP